MKVRNNLLSCIMGIAIMLLISCSTIGQHLPISPDEIVIGTIQTSFVARDSWFAKTETMNMQAYIKLLEAAVQKYPGNIDIRDVVWVTGRTVGPRDTEVSATARVIRVDLDETSN